MKNKLFRRAAVLTAALFSLTCMSVTAYAQSDEPAEETTPPAATETVAKPFTPDGTGTVVDNATDEDGNTISAVDQDCTILRIIDLHDFGIRHEESFVIGKNMQTQK